MLEFLRDAIWQFIGAFIGVVAILISIILYLQQRSIKALAYEIITDTSLFSVNTEVEGKLQIFYEGKQVQSLQLIEVKILNSGNAPIEFKDFERPVTMSFGQEARIFSAEVTETEPSSLIKDVLIQVKQEDKLEVRLNRIEKMKDLLIQRLPIFADRARVLKPNADKIVEVEEARISLKPLLLNKNDSITIKTLVGQYGGRIKVEGRVNGVKEIRLYFNQRSLLRDIVMISLILSGSFLLFSVFLSLIVPENLATIGITPLIIMFTFYLIMFVVMIIMKIRRGAYNTTKRYGREE